MTMSRKNTPKFTRKTEKSESEKFIISALSGFIAALALSLILSLVSSIILLTTKDPDSLTTLFAYLICAISLFFAGVFAMRISEGNILAPVFAGVMYTLLAFSLHLIFTAGGAESSPLSLFFLAFPIVSLLGGYVGRPMRKKGKKKFKAH